MREALALGALSAGVLALQVALTRVLSLVVWYHFAFLVVAAALLGFTAGGALVRARPALLSPDPPRQLARGALAFALTTGLAMLALPRLPLGEGVAGSPAQVALFVVLVLLVVMPFLAAGFVVAATFVEGRARVAPLYLANLAGSGAGCVLALLALDRLGGGPAGVLGAGALGAVAALLWSLAPTARRERVASVALLAALGGLLVLAREPLREPFYLPNAKVYPRVAREDVIERRWNALACVDFFRNPLHHGLWGVSPVYRGPLPDQIGVVIDAWAITSIVRAERGQELGWPYRMGHPVMPWLPASFPHLLRAATRTRARGGDRVLVIGAGGGIDVRTALAFRAAHVEAVEIDPLIVDAVRGRFARYSGELYAHPRVEVVVAEGRHHLERSPRRYDLVQLSGVDTYAATQAGAFALSENHLYTVEAFRAYLGHLRPGGLVALTRWLYDPPRQTLRLLTVAERALRDRGVRHAERHLLVVGVPIAGPIHFSVVLVRLEPFTAGEIAAARRLAVDRTWYLAYAPGDEVLARDAPGAAPFTRRPARGRPAAFARYFAAPDRDAFVAAYPYRIEPTTDAEPFFFEHHRWSRLAGSADAILRDGSGQLLLALTLLLALGAGALLVGVPLLRARRRPGGAPLGAATLALFAALGLGYVLVEVVLAQRFVLFLGDPGSALSVVLASLLVASGLGGMLARRLGPAARGATGVLLALAAIAALLLVYAHALDAVFAATLLLPDAARVAIAVGLVGAVGLLLGVPYPTLLARVGATERGGDAVAHAWVANGAASVVGSVLATVLAVGAGFDVVLAAAAGAYLLAAVLLLGLELRAAAELRATAVELRAETGGADRIRTGE